LSTRDTVAIETPASSATCRIVTRPALAALDELASSSGSAGSASIGMAPK